MLKNKICNLQNEINNKIFYRNVPSKNIEVYLDFNNINQRKLKYNDYDITKIFYPGTNKPPYIFFSKNINTESQLRNQVYALQKCNQSFYIPSSKSDLYTLNYMENKYVTKEVPNKEISNKEIFNNKEIYLFNNPTRSQFL